MEHYGINRHYQHLLHDVRHGLFFKKEFWRNEWFFDPKRTGTYISVWIDSCRQYDLLTTRERQNTEEAFRHGYLESLKTVQMKLQLLPKYLLSFYDDRENKEKHVVTDSATADLLYSTTESARNARLLFQWKRMSALPTEDATAGRIVYLTQHWFRAAYLRGIHYALEHLSAKWNDLTEWYGKEKRCMHTYLMEMTLPLLLVDADQCLEYTIPVSLFPMNGFMEADQTHETGVDSTALLLPGP